MDLTISTWHRPVGLCFLCAIAVMHASSALALATPVLYGSDEVSNTIITIDPNTASATLVGPQGINSLPGGLAYDPWTDTLFMSNANAVNASLSRLATIDRATGNATIIGANIFGFAVGVGGLAFDRNSRTLYGSTNNDRLITIDQTNGLGTEVGALGVSTLGSGLAYDYLQDVLYMVSHATDSLYTVDTGTGAATLVGSLNLPANGLNFGLAYDPDVGLVMSSQNRDRLYQLDTDTGQATEIGFLLDTAGLAFVAPAAVPEPATATLGLLGIVALARRRRRPVV